jgi:hypothetical protein
MGSILSGQELTRMLALVESPGDLVAQTLLQQNAARRSRSARFGGPIGFAARPTGHAGNSGVRIANSRRLFSVSSSNLCPTIL